MFNKLNFAVKLVLCVLLASYMLCPPLMAQPATPLFTAAPQSYSVSKEEGITAKVLPDHTALAITGSGAQKVAVIPLEGINVQPDTDYRVHYKLRADALQEAANVYLLIREHETEKASPIKPYHVESTRSRNLQPDATGKWIEHELYFKTGAKTHVLSGSIVIVKLKGTLSLSALEVWEDAAYAAKQQAKEAADAAQAAAQSASAMAQIRKEAAARKPLTPRPRVFSRSQMKYPLGKNYYHEWTDRPLLANRDYRVPSPFITPLPSYKRTLEEVRNYDMDGLAFSRRPRAAWPCLMRTPKRLFPAWDYCRSFFPRMMPKR